MSNFEQFLRGSFAVTIKCRKPLFVASAFRLYTQPHGRLQNHDNGTPRQLGKGRADAGV